MSPPALGERLDPSFAPALSPILLAELESADYTIVGVDQRLLIRYLNPGWFGFMGLTGQDALQQLGDYLCDGFLEPEKSRHTRALMQCLETGKEWTMLCECACSDAYRLFRLKAEVIPGAGLILRYPLARKLVHDRPPQALDTGQFVDRYDIAKQCPQCMRYKSSTLGVWAWLQSWVADPPPILSRAFCPVCIENYYPGG